MPSIDSTMNGAGYFMIVYRKLKGCFSADPYVCVRFICGLLSVSACVACALVICVFVWPQPRHSLQIKDVTRVAQWTVTNSRTLLPRASTSGIIIECKGFIDGAARLELSCGQPIALHGTIDSVVHYDTLENDCIITYIPELAKRGEIEVRYRFH